MNSKSFFAILYIMKFNLLQWLAEIYGFLILTVEHTIFKLINFRKKYESISNLFQLINFCISVYLSSHFLLTKIKFKHNYKK